MLDKWFAKRAARKYAAVLHPWLIKNYGDGEVYTPAQIRNGIGALKLSPKYAAFGYAAFLRAPDYEALRTEMPWSPPFKDARALFIEYQPIKLYSRHTPHRKARR
jgi:hypothetical protein